MEWEDKKKRPERGGSSFGKKRKRGTASRTKTGQKKRVREALQGERRTWGTRQKIFNQRKRSFLIGC